MKSFRQFTLPLVADTDHFAIASPKFAAEARDDELLGTACMPTPPACNRRDGHRVNGSPYKDLSFS